MKKISLFIFVILCNLGLAFAQAPTNDFYDDVTTYSLFGPESIEICGEVSNPGTIDLSKFPLHSVIVKEAQLVDGSTKFIGAYRYDGISLYDILDHFILQKKNQKEFAPIIDLYVEIENEAGEKAILSWGEIYYPIHRHEILIATKVARIVPSKTKELWPLPQETKLVVASDLITERNISKPTKIRVVSASKKFEVNKGMDPMFTPELSIFEAEDQKANLKKLPKEIDEVIYETIFYGRGRGIHSTTPFQGIMIKDELLKHFALTPERIQKAYFIISAEDGYHGVFTYSEIINRNDQSELLLIDVGEKNAGKFRLFPAMDFFSDRAIKSAKGVYITEIK
jgi:hypothetical protein